MPTDLLDVNVWLENDAQHAHHSRAREYWEQESAPQIAFCRQSMLGLLRLGTNSKVMRGVPFTPGEAWQAHRALRLLPELTFVDEPRNLEAQLSVGSEHESFPVHAWTDCYLASVAILSGCRLVSSDRGFA